MKRRFGLVLALITLWPRIAAAQYSYIEVRDWTLHVGNGRYGLQLITQLPAGLQSTRICFGEHSMATGLPVAAIAGIALLLLLASILAVACLARWRAEASARARQAAG